MNTDGLQHYLTKVLGWRWVSSDIAPPSADVAPLSVSLGRDLSERPTRPLLVYTPFPLGLQEREILDKMIAALGLSNVPYLNATESSPVELEKFVIEHGARYVLAYGIAVPNVPNVAELQGIELPAISQFLHKSTPTQMQKLKRETWDQLKRKKTEWGL